MTEWVISDTHFQHENIIKYCSRPYKNAAQMDEDIFRRWVNRVKNEDIIYHLGDVGYIKGSQEILSDENIVQQYIRRLPGRKILIRGNHDKSPQVMRDVGFDVVCESMMVRVPNMNNTHVVLNHRPLKMLPRWSGDDHYMGGPEFVIHGHIHNSTPETRRELESKGELVDIPRFNINVSVEMTNYEPVALEHVVKNHIAKLKKEGRW